MTTAEPGQGGPAGRPGIGDGPASFNVEEHRQALASAQTEMVAALLTDLEVAGELLDVIQLATLRTALPEIVGNAVSGLSVAIAVEDSAHARTPVCWRATRLEFRQRLLGGGLTAGRNEQATGCARDTEEGYHVLGSQTRRNRLAG